MYILGYRSTVQSKTQTVQVLIHRPLHGWRHCTDKITLTMTEKQTRGTTTAQRAQLIQYFNGWKNRFWYQSWSWNRSRGGRSHFFRLRLRFCSKIFESGPDPHPDILQNWESNSCSDSVYNHPSNRNLPIFLPKKWSHGVLLLPKLKSDSGSGSGFSQILTPGPDPGPKENAESCRSRLR